MTTTSHIFPSESWIQAYEAELNRSAEYRDAARTWKEGPIAFVVLPEPAVGLPEGFCVWLDVEGGTCREARAVPLEEARRAPFCITATYARWKDVIESRLDPIAGMITRRLLLAGNLLTMLRYVRSSKAMVRCATRVPSRFGERRATA